jgi:hypothetical protein
MNCVQIGGTVKTRKYQNSRPKRPHNFTALLPDHATPISMANLGLLFTAAMF